MVSGQAPMAKILADREIQRLLGTVILDADSERINPNGIEIRLGKHVLFQATGEEKELSPGMYLKVRPGESVLISSLEKFAFTKQAICKAFPNCNLMALITPTTTMMREGIVQAATKVDSGWDGTLNWGLRNSSIRDFLLEYAEPIFKLTIFLLEGDEVTEIPYGQRPGDRYQGSAGITRSSRKISADIPERKIVSSCVDRIDPARQLREAGYPFDHISTELTDLHGKFEIVSKDFARLKDQFQEQTRELRGTIEEETKRLASKVEESQKTVLEKVQALFEHKFYSIAGTIVAAVTIMYGLVVFFQGQGLKGNALSAVSVVTGITILLIIHILSRRQS